MHVILLNFMFVTVSDNNIIASKQTANNIPVKENVAYSATEQFRKHIRVARNPAYEMAKNTAANRAHSPQA